MKYPDSHAPAADPRRRRFLQGLAAGGLLGGLGLWRQPLQAAGPDAGSGTLSGSEFALRIGELPVAVTGRPRLATVVNDLLPGPLLRWREGDSVTVHVTNDLAESTSIHWHGLVLPANMDGTPGLSFDGIAPGATFTYHFRLRQSGTYWYHSHSGFHQEQRGLYGALLIDPLEPEPFRWDRDYVVMLSDWTDETPARVLARLKKQSHYYNFHERTVGDFFRDARRDGLRATLAERAMWARMRMSATDLADISGYTYTYLLNGRAPAAGWTGLFRPGERVRLRFINAAAMTIFDVRIPGLMLTVVSADGQLVRPVQVEEFRIGNGETFDVIVTPQEDRAYTVYAQAMDRSGHACGTLAPRPGMHAPVPVPDRRAVLTAADMGHGDHGDRAAPAGHADHAGHAGHAAPLIPVLPGGITHHPAEFGPGVDMRVDTPSPRLDDPGIGLRDNGRRVLTYADLRSRFDDPDGREPERTIELHLTGHMERYVWSIDGVPAARAEPLRLVYGERVRIVLVNDTMMEHPFHLHGMWSDLEDEQGRFQVRKHTIRVPPGQLRSFRVTADALGRWAFHCHLLLHLAGMFRVVIVDEPADPGGSGTRKHEEHHHG